ncbi:TSUP family transporter [Flavobacterium sp. F372]|uniref:Probable membrane transporter protein n=1 Tax=Flavobacterium bernardetii TaxID=2813823 RepID=A0ABR7J1Q0_9FLAO|nr:TSUP family transporter [Flavobacterium bernardetii]MBC5835912.1 TSUP family transporter [Flavobacterium bernardetii]NHF71142.1 TSUP family transporter [Flavobacterium bernardetii]
MTNTLFPVFLKTETAQFLIVGGGNVGLEKTETLLKQNPKITIILVATYFHPKLKEIIHQNENISFYERAFEETDLENKDFVIITTDSPEVNRNVRELAKAKGIKVNAADQPDLCDFYLGSIVNKGNLKIAISTNGKSPVLAKRLREYFTEVIPDEIEENITQLNEFRNQHKGDFSQKLADLNEVTSVFEKKKSEKKKYKNLTFQLTLLFFAIFLGYGFSGIVSIDQVKEYSNQIPNAFYGMLLVGFFAQLVDGAVGLGYGITCSTSMMLLGIKLPAISGSIHTAEMFSSGISGFSHYKFGNVNKKLLWWLVIPGVIGAVSGALLLVYFGSKYEKITYGVLATYTMIMGFSLLRIAIRKQIPNRKSKNTGFLGFAGGFLDAFGGGGWGPIVTSTLLSRGKKSKYVIGTVSLAEFFVTMAASITFFASIGVSHWYIVVGLIIGGGLAAPLGARLAGKLPQKTALLLVAFLVIVFSIRMLLKIA